MSAWRPRRLPLEAISFSAFAVLSVVGAISVALFLVDLGGVRVFQGRERAEAVAMQAYRLEIYGRYGLPELNRILTRRAAVTWPGELFGLFDPAGRVVSGNLVALPSGLKPGVWGHAMGRTAAAGSVDLDAIANRLPDGYTLVSGRDRAGKKAFERDVRDSFILAVAIVVTASLGVGLALNLVMAKRVQMIADTAARIAGGDLSARAAVSARGNAFDQISDSLNAMLDRIEQLMTEMRMVTDSLAHDLRAPLTRARTAVEIALEPTSAEEERSQALEYARTQLDHVLSTFTALLDIARAEAGLSRELMQPVRLDALAEELAELFSPVIEDAGQQLVMGHVEPLVITAHAALLRQAVGNLLFNAARHAGDGAEVTLGARTADAFAEIAVADTGRGVPQDQLGRLAQRFVTLDGARGQSGSGLGLAIAGAAAKLHGGELLLQDNRPGLRAVLRLRRD